MSTRSAQDKIAFADFNPYFGCRGLVVHALGAGGDGGLIQRPCHAAEVFNGHLTVGVQSNHRSWLARHHDSAARGDSSEVSLLQMEDSVAACFDERGCRGHPVIEPPTVKAHHMHRCACVMRCTPGQDLGEVGRVLIGQKNPLQGLRGLAHAVEVPKHGLHVQPESCSVFPAAVATKDHGRCFEEFWRDAVRWQVSCSEHQHVPCHGGGTEGFHKRIRATFRCVVGNGF